MKTEKILVFSDSHGSTFVMTKLLEDPPEGLTAVFHLGDGSDEAERLMRHYPMYAYIGVRGNCDIFDRDRAETVVTERGGVRFMLTHGHTYGVKSSMMSAGVSAIAEKSEVLLYGHTHIADDEVLRTSMGTVRAVNPGSVRCADYAEITVDCGNVTVELKHYRSGEEETD